MDIHIPLKGTFQEKIEHFMQFTGYGYISAAAVYTIYTDSKLNMHLKALSLVFKMVLHL